LIRSLTQQTLYVLCINFPIFRY